MFREQCGEGKVRCQCSNQLNTIAKGLNSTWLTCSKLSKQLGAIWWLSTNKKLVRYWTGSGIDHVMNAWARTRLSVIVSDTSRTPNASTSPLCCRRQLQSIPRRSLAHPSNCRMWDKESGYSRLYDCMRLGVATTTNDLESQLQHRQVSRKWVVHEETSEKGT